MPHAAVSAAACTDFIVNSIFLVVVRYDPTTCRNAHHAPNFTSGSRAWCTSHPSASLTKTHFVKEGIVALEPSCLQSFLNLLA